MQSRRPIYSKHEDDPALRDAISDFVVGLAEVVDALQDLHSSGNFRELARSCLERADQARTFGYPLFADLASDVAGAAEDEKAERAEDGLRDLADVVRRIRMAHRGAA